MTDRVRYIWQCVRTAIDAAPRQLTAAAGLVSVLAAILAPMWAAAPVAGAAVATVLTVGSKAAKAIDEYLDALEGGTEAK